MRDNRLEKGADFADPAKFRTLPWDPPKGDRDYLRANSWGITLPGAPFVPGASSRPDCWIKILSWFLDRYPADWQARYLEQTAADGYTHVRLSVGDSMGPKDNGPDKTPGNEQSLDQLIATCKRVQGVVSALSGKPLYVRMMLGSKDFHTHDMTPQQFADYFGPIMEALGAAKAVDEYTPGWEWDLWNQPGLLSQPPLERPSVAIPKWVGHQAHAQGASCWMHFSSHRTSWFADKDPRGRFGYWQDLGDDVNGCDYQSYPDWTMTELQDRMVDTLWQFGQEGNRHKLRCDEDQATYMWENQRPDELDADTRGYFACCTVDDVKHTDARVWGYGNGARRPNGTTL